jgi:adenylate cyclase
LSSDSNQSPLDSDQKFRLAKIRHDLRTPINHVIGYSEILQEDAEGQVPVEFLNDLSKINSGGQQLLGLINRYLGEESFLTRNTDLQLLCHELRTPANHIIGYSELLLELCDEINKTEFKPDLEKIILAGKSWLNLMEENLLNNNATKFLRKSDQNDQQRANHEDWSKIRSNVSTSARPLDVFYSEQGNLLLADDDPGNRDLLKRRLEKLGYVVTTCNDGTAALATLREKKFDLALLDMVMPGLDGHEILAAIKNDADLQNIPVIMISALDQMDSIVRCIELGAEDYLQKPFNSVLLRARIGAALEKKRLRDWEKVYIKQIEEEQKQSERLLLNVLPRPVADRLKQGESFIVDSFPEVTVLFADLVGFTSMSARIQPKVVVKLLDEIFTAFDDLAEEHGMEKIKTIGDAYMAVAGVPLPKTNHAQATAAMALDMMSALRKFNHNRQTALEMRIGINTGPVIAGIIGRKKFIYDLWGDAVNTASRMESHGEPSQIQITQSTQKLLQTEFETKARGAILIKGKGTLNTYWLTGRK